ncbi:MAG: tRNA (adenosine(37)-N6)-threonylcarbamoyltransferase complex ATPase subunit type 1 TsaE [bacterium]
MSERTEGPAGTEAVGARVAAGLRPGDVVLVAGELGTGKTTLIRGACRALGVADPVTSPTFTIGQRYAGSLGPVSHLDLYRLQGLEGEDPGLLDDYLTGESIAFVEWPGDLEQGFVPAAIEEVRVVARVELRHAGGDAREVVVG